jgi:hypothetical protein
MLREILSTQQKLKINMDIDINLNETVACSMSQETGTSIHECEFQANYMTGTDNSLDDLETVSEE